MINVALLTAKNSPVIMPIISEFAGANIQISSIIVDEKGLSDVELERYCDRTGISTCDLQLLDKSIIDRNIYEVRNHNGTSTIDLINSLEVDILVNGGTPRILNRGTLNAPKLGVINCHPGLLPDFRGCSCVEWAIYLDKKIGNTVHWMTEEIDVGIILARESIKLSMQDKYVDARRKVYAAGFKLLAHSVSKVLDDPGYSRNLRKPSKGNYYQPISDALLNIVKRKLDDGRYKYQCVS